MASNEDSIQSVRKFLDQRVSLGWTDLDQAFAQVLKKATPNTQIIYVGDGIVSTTESDPAAFINRLKRSMSKSFRDHEVPALHAVSVGSSYESIVLKGIASMGGGSTRQISGETTPQETALELLNEIAQPGLKNVQVEFRGVKVAAVYPDHLPNIAAGTQQILVGRYLPDGKDQRGEVVVTGIQNGEPVTYVARFELQEAESGNSFIPRLWARAHLDALLQSGSNQMIQDEIIGLSEEFHIITPYTSLLVLVSDADRERFGVKRRFEMRDGEQFFAAGRDNANYELRQQQMQRAGNWRIGLRRHILAQLMGLGRDSKDFAPIPQRLTRLNSDRSLFSNGMVITGGYAGTTYSFDVSGTLSTHYDSLQSRGIVTATAASSPMNGGASWGGGSWGGGGGGGGFDDLNGLILAGESDADHPFSIRDEQLALPQQLTNMDLSKGLGRYQQWDFDELKELNEQRVLGQDNNLSVSRFDAGRNRGTQYSGFGRADKESMFSYYKRDSSHFGWNERYAISESQALGRRQQNQIPPLLALFPGLPAPPRTTHPSNADPKTNWSAEALEISKSLLREQALHETEGGIELHLTTQIWHTGFDRLIPSSQQTELYSAKQRLSHHFGQSNHPTIHWLDTQQRGVYSEAFLLGQRRKIEEGDLRTMPLNARDGSVTAIHESYPLYLVELEHRNDNQVILTLTHPEREKSQIRYSIDTQQHVILKSEQLNSGKVSSTITHSDFVKVAGLWWATKSVTTNSELTDIGAVTTRVIKEHSTESFQNTWHQELNLKDTVLFLEQPAPSLTSAKLRSSANSGTFADHFVQLLHHSLSQNWEDVFAHLRKMEELAGDKTGIVWLRVAVERLAGRNQDAKQRLVTLINKLVSDDSSDMFLAIHAMDSLYSLTDWNEFGAAHQSVRPIYERQPDVDVAMLSWHQRQVQVFQQLGETDAALALLKQIAIDIPGDSNLQIRYSEGLVAAGRLEDGLRYLREQMLIENHWQGGELTSLRESYADRLQNVGRYPELLVFLRDWLPLETGQSRVHARLLSALIMNDLTDECDKTLLDWLAEVEAAGKLTPSSNSRIDAAIELCFGSGHNLRRYHGIDHKWLPHLYKAAMHCVPREDRTQVARKITGNSYFYQSDEGDKLRAHTLNLLLEEVDSIPAERITHYLNIVRQGRLLLEEDEKLQIRQVTTDEWTHLSERILKRWEAEQNPQEKHRFAHPLRIIYASYLQAKHLPFLRRLVAEGPEEHHTTYREQLYNALLTQDWTEELEEELFTLWSTLSVADDEPTRLSELVPKLYTLVDTMLQNRIAAANQAIQDDGQTDELTKTERQEKQAEIVAAARTGVAKRLQAEWKMRTVDESILPRWLMAEKVYLDMRLDRNRADVLKWCWSELGDAPPSFNPDEEPTPEQQSREIFQSILRQRAWITVLNLSSRRKASPKLIERVLDYIDAGITQAEALSKTLDRSGDQEEEVDLAVVWKKSKYNFLIALDRPDELATVLKSWIASDSWNIPWKRALAKLSAERGEIKPAIELMESIESEDELSSADYRTLADWYLVEDLRTQYERSRIETYKALQEHQLSNYLNHKQNQYNVQSGPHELDEECLFALRALFEKSASPSNYFWQARGLYTATRDFRTLAVIPESLLGLTQQSVYQGLQQFSASILEEVRKEATADEMLSHIVDLRKRIEGGEVPRGADLDKHSQALDLRALDFMEALLERRSAKVLNQPGPHAERSLEALKRAFEHEWADGERHQYATLLERIGAIAHEKDQSVLLPLATEQMRQVKHLFDRSEPASHDRMKIGRIYANLLFSYYGKQDEGLRFFQTVIDEMAAANEGLIPFNYNQSVMLYASFLEYFSRFLEAEEFLQKHLDALEHSNQRWTYIVDLNQLHEHALHTRGRTSLGQGEELFDNLIARLEKLGTTSDQEYHRQQVIQTIANLFDHVLVSNYKFKQTKQNLLIFANQKLPKLLTRQPSYYQNHIGRFGAVINQRISALEALSFLLDRMDEYPARQEYHHQTRWQQNSWQLAQYRQHASASQKNPQRLAKLEARLLTYVLAELHSSLINRHHRNQAFYNIDHTYFWTAKADEFLAEAEAVLEERTDSPRTLTFVADFLYKSLDQHTRAIEVLFIAHHRGLLDDSAIRQLVKFLHEQGRYAESIALLEPYIERRPDDMRLRVLLITAYHHTQRFQQVNDLIADTDAHFHQEGRWVENNIIQLAHVCLLAKRLNLSTGYYEEAINLHQRSQPNRGIGNGTLSYYYQEMASAYSRLKNTEKAVDAAAAAIVSWGRDKENRDRAVDRLKEVIKNSDDLDGYLKKLATKAKKTGQDSPILRKAIGQVFQSQQEWQRAIDQYRLALELQPTDREVHQSLLECFDQLKDNDAAIRQVLRQIDFDRHNLSLYTTLAERTKQNPTLAERAATSIVESAPNEAETHAALAKFRNSQKRYQQAIPHWKKVAEYRKLEPTGLLGLAETQEKLRDWKGMQSSLQQLRKTEWPTRFGDVEKRIREMEKKMPDYR